MKAGILTFHDADNFGAVLQAYALQTVLERLGAESEFVVFRSWETPAVPAPPPQKRSPFSLAKLIVKRFLLRVRRAEVKNRAALFEQFRKAHMRRSPSFTMGQAEEVNDRYDVFIAGSDQIWNFQVLGADGRYFLPFAAPEKRFSYAASLNGSSIPEPLRDWCAQELGKFHALSVREEVGREVVRSLTGRDSTVCLDPVLLLERKDWESLTHEVPGAPYALLHLTHSDPQLAARAERMAAERGLALQVITAGYTRKYGFAAWSRTSVEEWLSLIRGAAWVFTNSFHGTAFSLIFGRPLTAARLGGTAAAKNRRLEDLLELTGMERCFEEAAALSQADFSARLQARREEAMDYLRRIVS